MLGTARLLTFAFRALVLLFPVSVLWIGVAEQYNRAMVSLADPLLPAGVSATTVGAHVIFADSALAVPVSVDGFTMHYGLILMVVLVLASVGIGVASRMSWLLALVAGAFVMHVVGLALLGQGLAWAAGADSPEGSGRLVFSLFAVFWGLLPAVIGGLWCFLYWSPRASGGVRARRDHVAIAGGGTSDGGGEAYR